MEMRVAFTAVFVLLVTQTLVDNVMSASSLSQYNPFGDVNNHPLIHGPDHIQLALYKQRNRILLATLRSECPSQAFRRTKREIISEVGETQLKIEKAMYSGLSKMLVQCQQTTSTVTSTSPTPKTSTTTTTSTTPTTSTTTTTSTTPTTSTTTTTSTTPTTSTTTTTSPLPTTTPTPQPAECQSAVNLTESWRLDHSGSDIRPINGGYTCDTRTMIENGRPWFRFSGAAGQKLLDKCPPTHSCGSDIGWWSDDAMPAQVGVEAHRQVYGSWRSGCSQFTATVTIMRCSTGNSHDFIYKYTTSRHFCNDSFCGMKVI